MLGCCPPVAAIESLFPTTDDAPTLEVAESAEAAALRADLEAREEWLRAADTDVWTLPLSTLELSEILQAKHNTQSGFVSVALGSVLGPKCLSSCILVMKA